MVSLDPILRSPIPTNETNVSSTCPQVMQSLVVAPSSQPDVQGQWQVGGFFNSNSVRKIQLNLEKGVWMFFFVFMDAQEEIPATKTEESGVWPSSIWNSDSQQF